MDAIVTLIVIVIVIFIMIVIEIGSVIEEWCVGSGLARS